LQYLASWNIPQLTVLLSELDASVLPSGESAKAKYPVGCRHGFDQFSAGHIPYFDSLVI